MVCLAIMSLLIQHNNTPARGSEDLSVVYHDTHNCWAYQIYQHKQTFY